MEYRKGVGRTGQGGASAPAVSRWVRQAAFGSILAIALLGTWSCDAQENDVTISLAGTATVHPGNHPIERVKVQLLLLEPGNEPLATTYTDSAGRYEMVARVPGEVCSAGYNQAFLQLRAQRTDVSTSPETLRPECLTAPQREMNFFFSGIDDEGDSG